MGDGAINEEVEYVMEAVNENERWSKSLVQAGHRGGLSAWHRLDVDVEEQESRYGSLAVSAKQAVAYYQ